MWMLLLLFLIAVVYGYFYLTKNYQYWKKRHVPHPPVSILFGNLKDSFTFKKSLGQTYADIYNRYPDLPYVGFYKMRNPGIVLRDPELIKEILVKDFPSFHTNDIMIDEKNDPLLTKNPFFTTGEPWKYYRTALTSAFTSKHIKSMYLLMDEICKKLIKYTNENQNNKNGFDAKDLCQKYTMDVVANCTIGLEANSFIDPNNKFKQMAHKIISPSLLMSIKLLLVFAMPSVINFLKVQGIPEESDHYFRNIVDETLRYRKENNVIRGDFLDMMQDLKTKLGDKFTNEDITAHALSFFTDGFETTSILLSHMLYELGVNPQLQEKLRLEIEETFEKNDRKFTFEVVQEMVYLNKFLSETIRKYPPNLFMGKVCTQRFTLPSPDGKAPKVTIEPGTPVIISLYGLQHDPKYFKDPEKFDPERFSDENKNDIVKFAYIPFGEGPRMCIGRRFAVSQVKAAIVHLVREFEIRVNKKTVTPLEIDPTYFLLAAKGGIWLDFCTRKKRQ